jgi:hypothetical protein
VRTTGSLCLIEAYMRRDKVPTTTLFGAGILVEAR